MYLLYLDESGAHGGSPAYILGGIAVHEHDVYHVQQRLEGMLQNSLAGSPASTLSCTPTRSSHRSSRANSTRPRQNVPGDRLGSGKTTTLLKVLCEQIVAGRPVIAIDLKGSGSFARQIQTACQVAGRPLHSCLRAGSGTGTRWPTATRLSSRTS